MYSNIIDTFPNDEENPIRFYYYSGQIKYMSGYGERNTIDPKSGDIVLKMTIKCTLKNHDGYCSSFDIFSDEDKDSFIHSREQIEKIYLKIPDEFLDESTQKIREDILDNESNIINNEITERLFQEWEGHSDCNGSGCCTLYDIFTPVKIEYVLIT